MLWSGSVSQIVDRNANVANDERMATATQSCVVIPGKPARLAWDTVRFRRGTPADDFRRRVRAAVRAVWDGEPSENIGLGVAVIGPGNPVDMAAADVARTVRLALAGVLYPVDFDPPSRQTMAEHGATWAVRVWWWHVADAPQNAGYSPGT